MSSMKFRTIEAILPYRDKQQSVKSFFTKSVSSPATKIKKELDDEVVIVSQDPIKNKNTVEYIPEVANQRPVVPMCETRTTSNQIIKKQKTGDHHHNHAVTITTKNTVARSPMKKPSPSKTIHTNNNSATPTIDTFFTSKLTRK